MLIHDKIPSLVLKELVKLPGRWWVKLWTSSLLLLCQTVSVHRLVLVTWSHPSLIGPHNAVSAAYWSICRIFKSHPSYLITYWLWYGGHRLLLNQKVRYRSIWSCFLYTFFYIEYRLRGNNIRPSQKFCYWLMSPGWRVCTSLARY